MSQQRFPVIPASLIMMNRPSGKPGRAGYQPEQIHPVLFMTVQHFGAQRRALYLVANCERSVTSMGFTARSLACSVPETYQTRHRNNLQCDILPQGVL